MSEGLQHVGDDVERCAYCGRPAAGPCATCKKMVCGECCVLTEGGVQTWAICLRCDRKGGRSLRSAWTGILIWGLGMLLILGALAFVAVWLAHAG